MKKLLWNTWECVASAAMVVIILITVYLNFSIFVDAFLGPEDRHISIYDKLVGKPCAEFKHTLNILKKEIMK